MALWSQASGADEATHPSAAILAGYSYNNSCNGLGPELPDYCDPYGVGFGLRIGVTFPFQLYLRGVVVYHLGYSLLDGGVKAHTWYPGGEAGFDLPLGPVIVRPYIGVGAVVFRLTAAPPPGATSPNHSESWVDPAVWPGVSVLVPIGHFFAGLDGYGIAAGPSDAGESTIGAFAMAGARL